MAGHQHVGEGHQALEGLVVDDLAGQVLEEQRAFLLVHVDGQVAEPARLQPADHCMGIHQSAARGVDEHRARLHPRQRGVIDQVLGIGRQRAVQRDDVSARQQFIQRHHLADTREGRRRVRVVPQHRAAHTLEDARGGQADLAGTDDADRAAMQGAPEQAVEHEVAFAHAVVGSMGLAVEGHHQRQCMLGHGFGRIRRHPRDEQVQRFRSGKVHIVEARTAQQHGPHTQRVQRAQHLRIQPIVDEHADRGAVLCQRCGMHIQRGIEVDERATLPRRLTQVGFVQEATVVGSGAEDGDLHGRTWMECHADHTAATRPWGWHRRCEHRRCPVPLRTCNPAPASRRSGSARHDARPRSRP